MLQSLHIQNYALIDRLDISFDSGFSVITGETGAGKSILLGAIGLLLGQRADLKSIKAGTNRCTIEAHFDLSAYGFDTYFSAHDLDFDGSECIIRRELTPNGKSRAFINDTPVSLTDLKELGEQLIDIHSQHQNLLLNREDFQLNVLDVIAENKDLLQNYRKGYKALCATREKLSIAQQQYEKGREEEDYIAFQLQQLEDTNLSEEEESELEKELNTLEHAEDIKSSLYQSYGLLDGDEGGLISLIRDTQRCLEGIAPVYTSAQEWSERMESCYIELKDIAKEIAREAEQVDYDPQRLAYVNERISVLHTLKQKFHKDDVAQLIALRDELAAQMSCIRNSDSLLTALKDEIKQQEKTLKAQADVLTERRRKAAQTVEQEMEQRLIPLGMPNIRFQIDIQSAEQLGSSGCDKVTFLFSANKNRPLQPIVQVASGGEIARLMLSLKAMISSVEKLPTIIFDEIDTGVSGQSAECMGEIMQEMGLEQHRQVISITHLPQIAAKGNRHYRVYKTDDADGTTSHIVQLNTEERIKELAQMLSGTTLTQAAIDNAKALLGNN